MVFVKSESFFVAVATLAESVAGVVTWDSAINGNKNIEKAVSNLKYLFINFVLNGQRQVKTKTVFEGVWSHGGPSATPDFSLKFNPGFEENSDSKNEDQLVIEAR